MTTEPRRDPLGIVVAAVFLAIAAATLAAAIIIGGWGWLLVIITAPTLLFGAVGLTLDATKRPRDDKGHVIR